MSTSFESLISSGSHSARPSAGVPGRLYHEVDTTGVYRDNGSSWDLYAIWVSSAGGHTIEDEGTPLPTRTYLNFTGAGVAASDDSGNDRTNVTISGGGGGGGIDFLVAQVFS